MLSDDADEPDKFTFPAGTTITAGGYLIVWADGDADQDGLHTDFGLSANGESVVLSDVSGALIDQIDYPEQEEDVSYGRFPNGTGDFTAMDPTFDGENMLTTSTEAAVRADYQLKVFPNPAREVINLYVNPSVTTRLPYVVYDVNGREMTRGVLDGSVIIESHGWSPGLYVIRCGEVGLKVMVR